MYRANGKKSRILRVKRITLQPSTMKVLEREKKYSDMVATATVSKKEERSKRSAGRKSS